MYATSRNCRNTTVAYCIIVIFQFDVFIAGGSMEERYSTFINSFLVTIGLFLEQSPPDNPDTPHSVQNIFNRFIAAILIFSVLLNTAYSSGLSSILTIPQ